MNRQSRSVVLLTVFVLHAVVAGLMLRSRPVARPQLEGRPLQVSLIPLPAKAVEEAIELKPMMQEQRIVVPMPAVVLALSVEPAMVVVAIEQQVAPVVNASLGDQPILISAADYLRPPAPQYPSLARKQRQQGTVTLRVTIDTNGLPSVIEVFRSSGFALLDRAACDAVRRAIFKPYIEGGVARLAQVTIPIEFSLTQQLAGR